MRKNKMNCMCSGAVSLVKANEISEWDFEEEYRCCECGAFGWLEFMDGREIRKGCLA